MALLPDGFLSPCLVFHSAYHQRAELTFVSVQLDDGLVRTRAYHAQTIVSKTWQQRWTHPPPTRALTLSLIRYVNFPLLKLMGQAIFFLLAKN